MRLCRAAARQGPEKARQGPATAPSESEKRHPPRSSVPLRGSGLYGFPVLGRKRRRDNHGDTGKTERRVRVFESTKYTKEKKMQKSDVADSTTLSLLFSVSSVTSAVDFCGFSRIVAAKRLTAAVSEGAEGREEEREFLPTKYAKSAKEIPGFSPCSPWLTLFSFPSPASQYSTTTNCLPSTSNWLTGFALFARLQLLSSTR